MRKNFDPVLTLKNEVCIYRVIMERAMVVEPLIEILLREKVYV
jgi:hypothetical protein